MKKVALFLIIISTLACSQNEDGNILLKVKNTSAVNYTDIVVNTSGGEQNYGTLTAEQTSTYKPFNLAYHYAFIELKIDGQTYTIQPIDYVGETPLKNGKYTYEVNATSSGEQYSRLSLTLVNN